MSDSEPKSILDGLPVSMQKRMLEAQYRTVPKYREQLASALIHQDSDFETWVEKLLQTNCPITLKYDYLQLEDILRDNCQDDGGLKKVYVSFSILVKYGVNLMKPQSTRPQGWASVSFSNAVFKEKVDCIKGARLVLDLLGYTQKEPDSQSFPPNTQPHVDRVSKVTADIVIAQAEIKAYLNKTHPYPTKFEEFLHHLRTPDSLRPTTLRNGPDDLQSNSLDTPSPKVLTPSNTWASGWTDHKTSPTVEEDNLIKFDCGQAGDGSGVDNTQTETDDDCDICGAAESEWMCSHCDDKRLCTPCDDRWHSHPKRRDHKRAPIEAKTKKPAPPSRPTPVAVSKPPVMEKPTLDRKLLDGSENVYTQINPTINKIPPIQAPLQELHLTDDLVSLQPPISKPVNKPETSADSLPLLPTFYTKPQVTKKPQGKLSAGAATPFSQSTSASMDSKKVREELEKLSDVRVKLEKLDSYLSKFEEQIRENDDKINDIVRKTQYFTIEKTYLTHCFARDRLKRDQMLLQDYKKELLEEQKALSLLTSDMSLDEHLSEMKSIARAPPVSYQPPSLTSSSESASFSSSSMVPPPNVPPCNPPSSVATTEKGSSPIVEDLKVVKAKDIPSPPEPSAAGAKKDGAVWNCQHCTFENSPDTKICVMCDKTSDIVTHPFESKQGTNSQEDPVHRWGLDNIDQNQSCSSNVTSEEDNTSYHLADLGISGGHAYLDLTASNNVNIRKVIEEQEEEENLLEEKRRAREEFERRERGGNQEGKDEHHLSYPEVDKVRSKKNENLGKEESYEMFHAEVRIPKQLYEEEMWSIRESEEGATPSLMANARHSLQRDMQKQIQAREEEKANQALAAEGRKLIGKLRATEINGYTIEEFKFACNMALEGTDPLHWLNNEWMAMLKDYIKVASAKVHELQTVYQGEFPISTAKSSLITAEGNQEVAVANGVRQFHNEIEELMRDTEDKTALKNALNLHKGNLKKTREELLVGQVKRFNQSIWTETQEDELYANMESELDEVKLKNSDIPFQRRVRLVLVHTKLEWYQAEGAVSMWNNPGIPEDTNFEDVLEAVLNSHTLEDAMTFLCQECEICYASYPPRKIMGLSSCQCKVCEDCMKQHFEVMITEKYVKDITCPFCQQPDVENPEEVGVHFEFLATVLKILGVSEHIYELYLKKLTEWNLMKDQHFRWCSHCGVGFIWHHPARQLKMLCPHCGKLTCYECKKPWESQHQDITCEEFQAWKESNDPDFQAEGLKRHLEENGIDCPKCSMRYSLAKGGCMHFKCTQCSHEFCCGCSQPFKHGKACKLLKTCAKSGLHCHHPRDCLYYLRDRDVKELQKLLQEREVEYDTNLPSNVALSPEIGDLKCTVKEQKETTEGLKDEQCGRSVPKDFAGLCEIHYKEYLVSLINKNCIDPVEIMDLKELKQQLDRLEKKLPKQQKKEKEDGYRLRLMEMVQKEIPLPMKAKRTASMANIHLV